MQEFSTTTELDYNIPKSLEFQGEQESKIKTGGRTCTFRDNWQKPPKKLNFEDFVKIRFFDTFNRTIG